MARSFVLFEGDIARNIAARAKPGALAPKPNVVTVEITGDAAVLDALADDPLMMQKAQQAAVKVIRETVDDIARTLKRYEKLLATTRSAAEHAEVTGDFQDFYAQRLKEMEKDACAAARKAIDAVARTRDDLKSFKVEAVARAGKAALKSAGKKAITAAAMGSVTLGVGTIVGLANELRKVAWEGYTLWRDVEKDIAAIEKKLDALAKVIRTEQAGKGKGKKAAAASMARNAGRMAASQVPGLNLAPSIAEIEKDLWRVRGKFAKIETSNHKAAARLASLLDKAGELAGTPAVAEDPKLRAEVKKVEAETAKLIEAITDGQERVADATKSFADITHRFEKLKGEKDASLAEKARQAIVKRMPGKLVGFADRRIKPGLDRLAAAKNGLEARAKALAKRVA